MLKRIGLFLACALLLFISWAAVLNMKSPLEKQAELVALADAEMGDGLYANAEPYLLDAVSFNTKNTQAAMEKLKTVYVSLDSPQEYADVLKSQTARADCPAAAYGEYARYLIGRGYIEDALGMLKLGIGRTGEPSLVDFYEQERYAYSIGRDSFEDVTAYHNGGIQVKRDGLWGLSDRTGKIIIPCEYKRISAYDTVNKGCAVVLLADDTLLTVNLKNRVVAKTDLAAVEIGNLSENIIPLQLANGNWIVANSKLASSNTEYEGLGTCANSALAAKRNGKWGVLTSSGKTVLPYEYDEIIMDELGRCCAQNAVFAKVGSAVYLYVDGKQQGNVYEDARPFTDDGWAAAKKNGSWGFIDLTGQFMIEPQFDDALSFSGHLAAVRQGDLWGYVALNGKIVIEPQFLAAKPFYAGYAPVLTEEGFVFLSLVER
jgi:hypothetical protein